MKPSPSLLTLMLAAIAVAFAGCGSPLKGSASAEAQIRAMLEQQERDWNAGNLAAFMEGYAKSDTTRFASGGNVAYGWQTVFDRYRKKYTDPASMGKTTFSDLEVTMLSPGAAMAFGRWHQKGSNGEGSGVFTLILRKTSAGWRIIHDHTSVAETKVKG
jgi:ketosteroid isomerase-like protein